MFQERIETIKTGLKNFLEQFKQFAMRGNALHIAIGVIIGNAFSKIVASFVNDIAMPPLSVLLSFITFSDLKIELLSPQYNKVGHLVRSGVVIQIGHFIQAIIDFIIVALCVFVAVKAINVLTMRMDKKQLVSDTFEGTPDDKKIALLGQIRDLLLKQNKTDI
jgi:large conductance mechanosensitive channel